MRSHFSVTVLPSSCCKSEPYASHSLLWETIPMLLHVAPFTCCKSLPYVSHSCKKKDVFGDFYLNYPKTVFIRKTKICVRHEIIEEPSK